LNLTLVPERLEKYCRALEHFIEVTSIGTPQGNDPATPPQSFSPLLSRAIIAASEHLEGTWLDLDARDWFLFPCPDQADTHIQFALRWSFEVFGTVLTRWGFLIAMSEHQGRQRVRFVNPEGIRSFEPAPYRPRTLRHPLEVRDVESTALRRAIALLRHGRVQSPPAVEAHEQLVSLDQAAALAKRRKRTLYNYRGKGLPEPVAGTGHGGQPYLYKWSDMYNFITLTFNIEVKYEINFDLFRLGSEGTENF
jgi:hypothetical protein